MHHTTARLKVSYVKLYRWKIVRSEGPSRDHLITRGTVTPEPSLSQRRRGKGPWCFQKQLATSDSEVRRRFSFGTYKECQPVSGVRCGAGVSFGRRYNTLQLNPSSSGFDKRCITHEGIPAQRCHVFLALVSGSSENEVATQMTATSTSGSIDTLATDWIEHDFDTAIALLLTQSSKIDAGKRL